MTKKWFVAALIRSVRTFAQVMAGGITIGVALSEINWAYLASTAVVSAIYSILTSLAGLPEVDLEKEVAAAEANQEVRIVYVPEEDRTTNGTVVFLNTEEEDVEEEDGEEMEEEE